MIILMSIFLLNCGKNKGCASIQGKAKRHSQSIKMNVEAIALKGEETHESLAKSIRKVLKLAQKDLKKVLNEIYEIIDKLIRYNVSKGFKKLLNLVDINHKDELGNFMLMKAINSYIEAVKHNRNADVLAAAKKNIVSILAKSPDLSLTNAGNETIWTVIDRSTLSADQKSDLKQFIQDNYRPLELTDVVPTEQK